MQFGKVDHPENIDFSLPTDASETHLLLQSLKSEKDLAAYVGCAKWNRSDLKGFYPRGVKDELTYYANQFNAIELNATFYRMPDLQQVEKWKDKTTPGFKFFPKITNTISHLKRLNDVQETVERFCDAISGFDNKLGMVFLQLHENFKPKDFPKLKLMLENFPKGIPLGVEVRNEEWFSDREVSKKYTSLLEKLNMSNIIVDTAGRRDMLHMRLTNATAFIRYVGANHPSDIDRLNDWVSRIHKWRKEGLQNLYFFVHQNSEVESPLLAAYFIQEINKKLKLSLKVPQLSQNQSTLF